MITHIRFRKCLLGLIVFVAVGLFIGRPASAFSPLPQIKSASIDYQQKFSDNSISFSENITLNNHPTLAGKDLLIGILVCDGYSPYSSYTNCELSAESVQWLSFLNNTTSLIQFNGVKLPYKGRNIIFTLMYDPISGVETPIGCDYTYPAPSGYFMCFGSATTNGYLVVDYIGAKLPIYRFWSNTYKHHFFTQSAQEMNDVSRRYADNIWKYESIAFYTSRPDACQGSPVYRFWSDAYRGHFYTISKAERDFIASNYPSNVWRYENVAYCAYQTAQPGTIPVHRFWSDTYRGHFYTTSEAEKNSIIANYPSNVWRYEGVAFYAFTD